MVNWEGGGKSLLQSVLWFCGRVVMEGLRKIRPSED
jgi:hypothetical protein